MTSDPLLPYFEGELQFIRRQAGEFAAKYPDRAGRLHLDTEGQCSDPQVERLIEAFALLTARVSKKVDDEFPEIVESLLGLLYPHFIRPVPSMAVVQLGTDPGQSQPAGGTVVERGTPIISLPVDGARCRFRTCFETTLWPIQVTSAEVVPAAALPPRTVPSEAHSCIRLRLRCTGDLALRDLRVNRLRFHLAGDGPIVHTLYELLFSRLLNVFVRDQAAGSQGLDILDADCVRAVGFAEDEAALPYSNRSFAGYRLMQEYFSFPRKFLFFDLHGLDNLTVAGGAHEFEVYFVLREFERKERLDLLESGISERTFRLGCTPIVNLFSKTAEPIRLKHTQTEYRVVPDLQSPRAAEVYSIDDVVATQPYARELTEYRPFYSISHGPSQGRDEAFWHSSRRASSRPDDHGTDVALSFTNLGFSPNLPSSEVITVRTTCTNRDWTERLPITGKPGEFQFEQGSLLQIRCLGKPTPTIRPPLKRGLHWRLLSHLALNHLSIVDGGKDALQEMLRLYLFSEEPMLKRRISGIRQITSQPDTACIAMSHGLAFCYGAAIRMEFDEDDYADGSTFLLASVLERFFGLYSSLNSFTRLTATSRQRAEPIKEWPARCGDQALV